LLEAAPDGHRLADRRLLIDDHPCGLSEIREPLAFRVNSPGLERDWLQR
jgi:hypothetical protein